MGDVLLRLSLHHSPYTPPLSPITNPPRLIPSRKLGLQAASIPSTHHPKPLSNFKIHAVAAENDEPKWWEKNAGLNMIDVHSTEEILNALIEAGDKLVIVEFYGTWCGSCRALFPKICKTAKEHPDIIFIKVNFDENKSMCKKLNVRVLPYFQFYRGADGLLESFSCSLAKFQKIKDAIAMHNTARCSIVPLLGVRDPNLLETSTSQENPAEPSPSSPNLSR